MNALISALRLDGRTLVVSNGVTVTNPGGIILSSNGASIENSGVWDATADGVILHPNPTSPGSVFRNTPTGILKKTGGAGTTSVKPRVVNDGVIENLSPGTLGLGQFSEGSPAQAFGKVHIAGSGPTLTGSGRLAPGVFQSFGAVAPGASAGTIQVTGSPGSWELGTAASESPTLQIEIGGTGAGQFDQLALAGAFTLPASFARLELSTLPSYTPVVGDQFAIVTGSSGFSGTFQTVTGTDLGGGKSFQVIYESNRVLVRVIGPDPAPSVTIDQAAGQADPTSSSPINFTAVFSEPVTGFAGNDVSFAGSTVGGTLSTSDSGSGPSYQVSVTGMSGSGTVVASTSTDNQVTFNQQTPPPGPSCNGVAATIYVGADGRIVGGPDNGKPYRGKLNGTPGADVMVGTPGRDEFAARGGNDRLCGGEGNDELEGGGGHDALFGEGGNDILDAGGGNDTMTGGLGADKFMGGTGTDTATDYTPSQGDTKTGVEVF